MALLPRGHRIAAMTLAVVGLAAACSNETVQQSTADLSTDPSDPALIEGQELAGLFIEVRRDPG